MTADIETLAFYDGEATAYAAYASDKAERDSLARFAALLEPGTSVLDFGCGSGWATHEFAGRGFRVSALDGSAGLAAEARRRYGVVVRVAAVRGARRRGAPRRHMGVVLPVARHPRGHAGASGAGCTGRWSPAAGSISA